VAAAALGAFGPLGKDTLVVFGAGSEAPAATLPELLEKAGRYVAALEESFTLLRAKEHCVQTQWVGMTYARHRYLTKTLDSDVLWAPGGDPMSWAFYRDVQTVDEA
jgi:hypothetical protein